MNRYKHISKTSLGVPELQEYERKNQAYQDTLGTENFMQSPYTLDVDETKVTARRSAYPDMRTATYFAGDKYNVKQVNMNLSNMVSARLRERTRPTLQPGDIIDPNLDMRVEYEYEAKDDTHMLLYIGAFVVGIVIFSSLL